MMEKTEKSVYIILVVLILLGWTLFTSAFFDGKYTHKEMQVETKKETINPFENIFIEASSAIVIDIISNKVIYEKNMNKQLPLASLTKIMTAIIALDSRQSDSIVTVDKESIDVEGDNGLYINEKWKLSDLLALTLIESSNDGARAISKYVSEEEIPNFIKNMNLKAKELGLKQTYFISESGLDIGNNVGGAYGSSYDVASLFLYGFKKFPEIFDRTRYDDISFLSESGNIHIAENTNVEVEKIPGILASKTGFTSISGGNLVVLFQISLLKQYIAVVLGSTMDGRFLDMEKLIRKTEEFNSLN